MIYKSCGCDILIHWEHWRGLCLEPLDRVVAHTSQITLIPLNGTHHGNILEQEKRISHQLKL